MLKNPSRWFMLAVICLYVFANYIVYQAFPPILSLIIEELGISHAEAGLVVAVYALPSILLAIPLSFYSSRIGLKKLGIISLALLLAGSAIIITAKSLPLLIIGRLIIGLGAVAVPFVGLEGVAQWFSGNRLGFAMGIYTTCMLGAVVISLSTFGTAGTLWGWKSAVWITIAVTAIALIIFTIFFKTPRSDTPKRVEIGMPSLKSLAQIGLPLWILGLNWGLFNIATVSITTFSPDFMYQNGFALGTAGLITSVILIVTAILSPFVGHIVDRIKYKELLNLIGGAACFLLLFLMPSYTGIIVIFMILIGVFTSPFASVTYATVPALVKPQMIALGYAIITAVCNVGWVIGPYLTGLVRDVTGTYKYSYWIIALFFLLVALLTAVSLLLQRRLNKQNLRSNTSPV